MERISKAFWIWCDFIEEDMTFLKLIQSKLFNYFDSPFFDIHMTLHGPFIQKQELDKIKIYNMCKNIGQTKIYANNYEVSKYPYTSLFIDICHSKNLIDLRNAFYDQIPINNNSFKFTPHISLIYGKFKEKDKLRHIRNLPKINNRTFTIKNIIIADVNESINKWKIIERIELK